MDLKLSLRLNVDELTNTHLETYETHYQVDGKQSHETVRHNVPGLIQQLREAQQESMAGGNGAMGPKTPLNIDAFQTYATIASDAAYHYERTANRRGHDTIEANIRGWAANAQTTEQELADCLNTTDQWINQIQGLFQPSRAFEVVQPCPDCGERFAYRQQDGETVRETALVVTARPPVAACKACGVQWEGIDAIERLEAVLRSEQVSA